MKTSLHRHLRKYITDIVAYGIDGTLFGMTPDKLPEVEAEIIACQQVLEDDHSVFSIQWVVIPREFHYSLSSAELLEWYLRYIQKYTLNVIRSVQTADGIEFRLMRSSRALMRFCQPQHIQVGDGEITVLHIAGGMLVQQKQCDRGQLEFIVEKTSAGSRVTLKVSDYCPLLLGSNNPSLWRKWLYRFTQACLHKIVTVRFLAMVYWRVTGKPVKKGVVKIVVRQGTAT